MHEAPRVIQLLWCPYSNASMDFTKQVKAENHWGLPHVNAALFQNVPN